MSAFYHVEGANLVRKPIKGKSFLKAVYEKGEDAEQRILKLNTSLVEQECISFLDKLRKCN